eukprot:TRINITY_DN1075_c0_g3_i3.p1 TRINITY_DN1075_c0_g3~~TRINITY_DN1075_c0_g3_i3.p1  ORF type:complete len:409 (+),score=54.50 TRINITY_DN1075_c0_g3_i3:548-1774(+)
MLHFFDLSPQTRVPLMLVVSLLHRTKNSETLELLFSSLFKKLQTNISKTKQWNVSLRTDRDEMRKTLGLDLVVEAVSLCKSDSLTDQFWKIISPSTFRRLWKYCAATDLQRGSLWQARALCVEPAASCGNTRLLEYLLGSLEGPQASEHFASMALIAAMAHRQKKAIPLATDRGATTNLTTAIRFNNTDVLCTLLKHQNHNEDVGDVLSALGMAHERHLAKSVSFLQPTAKNLLEKLDGYLNGNLVHARNSIIGVAFVLRVTETLQTLHLGYNKIGTEGAVTIAQALRHHPSLQYLNLWDNNIGPNGASAIARALQLNTSLKELYLNDNNIGTEGASVIAQALGDNTSLQTLYLSDNKIGAEGASAIAKALGDNCSLLEVNLFVNLIGAEGACAIAQALGGEYLPQKT